MKSTTGIGAVFDSPEAGTYTFRYRQSSDWLLDKYFVVKNIAIKIFIIKDIIIEIFFYQQHYY